MSYKHVRGTIHFIFIAVIFFFLFIIFLPAIYVLRFTNFNIFFNSLIIKAIISSFFIGLVVTLLNLIFGIPLAWVITRSKRRFVKWIDNLVDLSLVIPTAALGFSIYLYWGTTFGIGKLFGLDNGLVSRGPVMIILLHLVFTLPYMVRSVSAAIEQLDISYEEAAITLGASPFTFFRTIALPLFKDGVINGAILSFTRSLSETGATMIVAGYYATAPILIINLKDQGDLPDAAGVSIILIISAVLILMISKLLLGRRKIKLFNISSGFEKAVSKLSFSRNAILFVLFAIFIFIPTIFIILYSIGNIVLPDGLVFVESLSISLILASLVTIINLIFSVPLAYLIARNHLHIGGLLDTLSEVVLLVPTSALGLSLVLFWRPFIPSDLLILLLAHLSFTFPLLVKPLVSAFKEISLSQEEASYTLGASYLKTFSSVLLPQIKPAIIAGSVMAFMRSLSETGATLAVTKNIKTVTLLIVDLFNQNNFSEAAFACSILFIITLVFLFILKTSQDKTVHAV